MIRTMALSHAPEQTGRHGGGGTRVLLAWPQPDGRSLCLGVAQIVRDGPFSAFAGVQRRFAVLRGDAVRLALADTASLLTSAVAAVAFDGAAAPGYELLGGPTQDLNLMLRHDASSARMARICKRPD